MTPDHVAPREAQATGAAGDARASAVRRCGCLVAVTGMVIAMLSAAGVASAARHHLVRAQGAAPSTWCAGADLLPTQANTVLVGAATLCLVNAQRARRGERALRRNADLARSSALHSRDMVSGNYFGHVSPAGETPLDRIQAGSYLPPRSSYLVGENIALGMLQLATPSAIVGAWMASPDHRANILNRDFRDTGLGIVALAPSRYANGVLGATYTQQFGVIAR